MDYSVPKTVLSASPQVFKWRVGDEDVWVKKRRRRKNPLGWWIQRVAYRLTGLILALPPEWSREDNVTLESDMLRRLAGLGLRVPRVLHVDAGYFVMSDAGVTLEAYLAHNRDQAAEYTDRAARELRRLHDLGLAHGGAQIRNLTVRNDGIGFIDFESRVPDASLAEFQLRDVFLFLLSLERNGYDPDIAAVCRSYEGGDGARTRLAVCRALRQLRFVRIADSGVFFWLRMNDIRCLSNLVRKAERLWD